MNDRYRYGAITSPGMVRDHNEDRMGCFSVDDALLLVLSDGMGGHNAGEVAAGICVETLGRIFSERSSDDPSTILRDSLLEANVAIKEESNGDASLQGMGATVVATILRGDECWYAHIGDSRLYMLDKYAITQLTRDDTEVQKLVDYGVITSEQALKHPRGHVLSRAIGHYVPADGEIKTARIRLREGCAILLCSDGLTDLVSDQEILNHSIAAPQEACERLLELVMARGAHDNVTIQMVRYGA